MFKNIGWPEILLLSFVLLVIFGSSKLPEFGRNMGRSVRYLIDVLTEKGEPVKKQTKKK